MAKNNSSIWIDKEFQTYYDESRSKGIAVYYEKSLPDEKRTQTDKLIKWLRKRYFFPIRCSIFVRDCAKFKSKTRGKTCLGIFFAPQRESEVPQIFIAGCNVQDTVAYTLFHELTHYFQWYFLQDDKRSDRSLETEATKYANYLCENFLLSGNDDNVICEGKDVNE